MYWQREITRVIMIACLFGFVAGLFVTLSMEKVDELTSTDTFCSNSCHPMQAYVAFESTYIHSKHRTTYTGIQAGCADCHIPEGLLAATWTHAISGIKDTWSLIINDFSTRELWDRQRNEMAYRVRDRMLANDSETCRSCHQQEAIKPRRERGVRRHELAQRDNISCIACHYNLVHQPVDVRPEFLHKAGVWPQPSE